MQHETMVKIYVVACSHVVCIEAVAGIRAVAGHLTAPGNNRIHRSLTSLILPFWFHGKA